VEPLTQPTTDGPSIGAEQEDGSVIALLLVVALAIGVLFWFGASVVSAAASSCGGG
jgi:hypothetical protein